MIAARLNGLDALQRRLAARGLEPAIRDALQGEAEAIASGAADAAPGRLGKSIETIDESKSGRAAFAIGTRHRAGRFLEFGTRKMRARPFLWPVFRARLPLVKHKLTNTLRARLTKQ